MGIGVSSWRLARRVAQRGEIGIISGTGAETEGRGCFCNAPMANTGLPQYRDGYTELPLHTRGDALLNLPLGSVANPQYDADDVLDYLYGRMPTLAHATWESVGASD